MQTAEKAHQFEVLETIGSLNLSGVRRIEFRRVLGHGERLDIRNYRFFPHSGQWDPLKSGITFTYRQLQDLVIPILMRFFQRQDPNWVESFAKSLLDKSIRFEDDKIESKSPEVQSP